MGLSLRDRSRLKGTHPALVRELEALASLQELEQVPIFIVQGLRTAQQQAAAYAQGRTAPGPGADRTRPLGRIVTNCDGVRFLSPHQPKPDGLGYAADFAFVPTDERRDPFDPAWPWEELGERLEARGLIWGGRFHFADLDHAELPFPFAEALKTA